MSLYAFVQNTQFSQLPKHTQSLVSTSLLDIVGILAGAKDNQTTQNIRHYAASNYPPNALSSRLLFDGRSVHPMGAAWAGGFSADSLDAHEGHFTSKGHAGATVVPALLALADAYLAQGHAVSGEEFLSAIAIAYETGLRAGVALMDTAAEYHASGAFSGLGVVCGAARLLKLSEAEFLHALGIAEYFGPRCPMMRLVDFPSMLRDAHGAGAYSGINAILLAQAGITGAPAETVQKDLIQHCWNDLGDRWEIDAQYYKPWPVCRWAQPALTAVSQLMQAHNEVHTNNVKAIRVETFHESMRLQGHFPQNADEAQYGLAFPLAALICKGQVGPAEVTGEAINDQAILDISRKISIVESTELSARFPKEILSRVTLELLDGTTLTSPITQAKGDPETAMTAEEFIAKFHLLAAVSLTDQHIQKIIKEIQSLQDKSHCATLFDLLTQPGSCT
ncbi:MmgE/PrpD family protein [Marinomonas sp. 15G1-11]|uniref:MmgE/PrpD family protein n=1 Tax=Marinomonas phaeophyticola TaxID=3004091 RepID=A0ABT4JU70_9GAMM|nr:MmgE/PrpD family protein [Marinomonas sp. 15G1-11]MCZ2721945.1 MmgE/PrpD family protein [Marinomonas sp. 15G1-11]